MSHLDTAHQALTVAWQEICSRVEGKRACEVVVRVYISPEGVIRPPRMDIMGIDLAPRRAAQ